MQNWKTHMKEYSVITVGTAIIAVAVHFFMFASDLTLGSISALGLVVSHFVPLPISAITFIMNAALLLIGFLLIGREFGVKTVYTSILLPVFLRVLEVAAPNAQSFTGDAFLDMLCYILTVSIGQTLLFITNASSGGLDIVAKLLNKYFRMELGKAISLAGMCVALSSALLFDKKNVVLSVIGTYFNGIVLDNFIFGMNLKRRVCIISNKMEEIRQFILFELHSGATIYEAIGAYDFTAHKEIIAIVDKSEYSRLMDFVMKTDPAAFVTVYSVNEVNYRPKRIVKKESNDRL